MRFDPAVWFLAFIVSIIGYHHENMWTNRSILLFYNHAAIQDLYAVRGTLCTTILVTNGKRNKKFRTFSNILDFFIFSVFFELLLSIHTAALICPTQMQTGNLFHPGLIPECTSQKLADWNCPEFGLENLKGVSFSTLA